MLKRKGGFDVSKKLFLETFLKSLFQIYEKSKQLEKRKPEQLELSLGSGSQDEKEIEMDLAEIKPWIEIVEKSYTEKKRIMETIKAKKHKRLIALILEMAFFHPSRGKKREIDIVEPNFLCDQYSRCLQCPAYLDGKDCCSEGHPMYSVFSKIPGYKKALRRYSNHLCEQYRIAYEKEFGKQTGDLVDLKA